MAGFFFNWILFLFAHDILSRIKSHIVHDYYIYGGNVVCLCMLNHDIIKIYVDRVRFGSPFKKRCFMFLVNCVTVTSICVIL